MFLYQNKTKNNIFFYNFSYILSLLTFASIISNYVITTTTILF